MTFDRNARRFFTAAILVALGLSLARSASGQLPRVIYSDIVSSTTSEVPGLLGSRFTAFDRPYPSPDGSRWILSALIDVATATDEVIVSGAGLSGTVVVQEGVTPVVTGQPNELVGLIDRNLFITNSGNFAYATNTNGPTTTDEVIGRSVGGVLDVPAREGDATSISGATLGTSNFSPYLADDGRVGFVSTTLGGVPTNQNSAVFLGATVVAQEGVTVPAGQAGGATNPWEVFDFEDTYFANNGADILIRGDTNAASGDDILVYNGTVVLQEAQVVPGSSFVSPIATGGPAESLMTPNGVWFARGSNVDTIDWVVRQGAVLAATDQPVPGGLPGELFDDAIFTATFFSMAGNSLGDYVYGGVTNAVDINANAVLVYNNSSILLREGDPVDLNGNGLADDNAFLSVFNNEDAFLTDDLRYYFTADLRDGAGTELGQAFLTVVIPEPTLGAAWLLLALWAWRTRRA